jgi:hypothetical protein
LKICSGKCNHWWYTFKNKRKRSGSYGNGTVCCIICEIYYDYDGGWCPCCCNRLRKKPRSSGSGNIGYTGVRY